MVSDQKWLQEVTTETWFRNLRKPSRYVEIMASSNGRRKKKYVNSFFSSPEVHFCVDWGGRPEREGRRQWGEKHWAEDHSLHWSCKVKFLYLKDHINFPFDLRNLETFFLSKRFLIYNHKPEYILKEVILDLWNIFNWKSICCRTHWSYDQSLYERTSWSESITTNLARCFSFSNVSIPEHFSCLYSYSWTVTLCHHLLTYKLCSYSGKTCWLMYKGSRLAQGRGRWKHPHFDTLQQNHYKHVISKDSQHCY